MKDKSVIDKKIEATLHSIHNIKPAISSPHFYTKLLARINTAKITIWEKWSAFFLRPSIAFAAICFIIVTNAYVLYSKYDTNTSATNQAEMASSDEYSETVTALYDLENVKP